MATTYNAGIVTAYGAAVQGGYTGTYAEYCTAQANIAINADRAEDAAERAEEAAAQGGMTDDIKQALLQIARNVAYLDDDSPSYYDALYDALYPPADLDSISAVYTQSGTVYDTDTLDSLKPNLVVTAHYSDQTTAVVTTYTLSGTLTEGASTITVSYGGKTTTFTVTVAAYVSNGLFAYWDGIDNRANGTHDSSATTWVDKINGYTWTADKTDGTQWWSWENDALAFAPTTTGDKPTLGKNTFKCARPGTGLRTLEVVFTPQSVAACLGEFTSDNTNLTDENEQIIGVLSSDNTFITKGKQNGFSAGNITNIKSITATYDATYAAVTAYMNGTEVTTRGSSHSFKYHHFTEMVLGAQNNTANLTYPFKGKIHAIRFYDRELTAEEIAENYALDAVRYGLS